MRAVLALLILATPAGAWEFSPRPICTLSHEDTGASVRVTFDSASGDYAIALTRPSPWAPAPVFGISFEGPRGLTISTTRQVLSDQGRTLTVTDKGFGNVLNGIEFNQTASAFSGSDSIRFSLAGAAPEVQAFRACAEGGMV